MVTAVAGDGQVSVSWNTPFDGGAPLIDFTIVGSPGGFKVSAFQPPGGRETDIVTGLTNGVHYTFTVTARNGIGSSAPSIPTAGVIPIGRPNLAPTSVTPTAGIQQVSVSFVPVVPPGDGGSPVDSYRVSVYTTDGTLQGQTTSGVTSPLVVTGLVTGLSYTATVAAHNTFGFGPESPHSSIFVPTGPFTVPAMISSETVVGGPSDLLVTWGTPGNGGTPIIDYTISFVPFVTPPVQVIGVGTTPATAQLTVAWSTPANGGSPLLDYTVNVVPLPPSAPDQVAGQTVTAETASLLVTWPTPDDGNSVILDYTVEVDQTVAVQPGQVTGVLVAADNGTLTVTWPAPPPNGGSILLDYTIVVT